MKEWKSYKLGDLVNLYSGGTPNKAELSYWSGNIPWISAKSMYDDFLDSSDMCISESGLNNGSKLAKKGTILLLTRGSGLFNRIPVCWTCRDLAFNQDIKNIVSKDESIVSTEYLFYWLYGNKTVISSILETTGIGAGKIDTERFLSLDVLLPKLKVQEQILHTVKPLFKKIEFNNCINNNLEELAQAIFKSWFVDFEPFQDGSVVDSELGTIPKGWDVIPLGDILNYHKRTISPQKYPDTVFTHYSLPAFDNSKEPEIQKGSEIMSNKILVENKMILFSKLNPRIKRLWFIDNIPSDSICSTEFIAYKAKEELMYPFCWCYLNGKGFYDSVLSVVNGATGSHQRFHAEETLKYLIPFNREVILTFSRLVAPILQTILNNESENKALKKTRDTILPKLFSGELAV